MLRPRLGAAALVALVSLPVVLPAQTSSARRNRWELLLSSGALIPTGAQRSAIKTAQLSAAQLSYVVGSRVAVTGMFGWARSRDLTTADNPKLDVFTLDVGAEARTSQRAEVRDYVTGFKPLVGSGNAATRNDVVALLGLRLTSRARNAVA